MARLTAADAELDPVPLAAMSQNGAIVVGEAEPEPRVGEFVSVEAPPALESLELTEVEVAMAADDSGDPIDETGCLIAQVLREQEVEDDDEPPSGFIISISMRGQCRRLHFAGGCFRVAGEHYTKFESYGQTCPPANIYTHRCKDCFPAGRVAELRDESEMVVSEAEEASASSSSSSSAGSVAPAQPGS